MANLTPLGAPARPRRRGDLETTPGRCANLDYCSIGMQRVLVTIPVNQPFTCPECGGRLRPPGAAGRPWVLPAIRIGLFVVGIVLGAVLGFLIGRGQRAPNRPVAVASPDTVAQVNAARSVLGLPKLPPEAVKPVPVEAPTPAPAPQAAPVLVEPRPFPARPPPLESADPPLRLSGEQRFGQVTIDCALGAVETKPSCRTSDRRGADAFSASAVPWLENLAVQYKPATSLGAPALLDHRWRVIFEDYAGSPPQPQALPPQKHHHRQR